MSVRRVLVIAGSDSSGGAGLEADQRVLAAHEIYTMTATTALTAQNTLGVGDIHVVPPKFVGKQIRQVMDDIGCDVVKMGMLASAATIEVIADTLQEYDIKSIILDPVMVSTSGAQLLPGDAVRILRKKLLPVTTILTPNIPEAILLLRDADEYVKNPSNLDEAKTLAKQVHGLGPKAVLLKGGHIPLAKDYTKPRSDDNASVVVDILYDGSDYTLVEAQYSTSKNTHGTGCSLASAIAANIASDQELPAAVRNACRYVEAGITTSKTLGRGNGPINHFHSTYHLPFAPGRFIEFLLQRPDVRHVWNSYTQHGFVQQLAQGTLPRDLFKNYLVQDYLYLTHFARTNALAAYKSTSMDSISASAHIVLHIEREMSLHLDYCQQFGLSRSDIEKQKESQACVAYSRYVLDVGQSQDWLALQMALAPCLLGYGAAAQRLHSSADSVKEGNPYWKWIENYVADDYVEAVRKGSALIESSICKQSPARIEELVKIFIRATEMEIRFWDFGAHS
ncbi:hypothetical protein EPUS_01842 [Endocarpon pusillum Z07020]|uniref:Hydroxymethylpyrimidine/phosphomethylpyrimidine kinase 2 n=1 Tax=Endocarpon pusillum (strain Z07020 / HMAS-L-300199) TaxID=1263415 RepID=U1GBT2_ENDPU|nr:uncharacterized protein EPUS_01842 [Endocarpon pusillum Z07020]ERF69513.1 hypothetical protein EPUS_01842 [Endocarpon pusillum Z07020]